MATLRTGIITCRITYSTTFCFLLAFFLLMFMSAGPLHANPDVYSVLPEDTHVVQYAVGDIDGKSGEELAVLYTSGGMANLALFKTRKGRWSLWWTDGGTSSEMEGAAPSSVELSDVNGDGINEILVYSLSGKESGMTARIITLDTSEPSNPFAEVILEDTTVPPGYPLFGLEKGAPSVTFLKMPLKKGDVGHRRVYCWDGKRFEKCVEVPWIKP